jgi:hypothetical protein
MEKQRFMHLFSHCQINGQQRSFGLTFTWRIKEQDEHEIKVSCAVARCHNEKSFCKMDGRTMASNRLSRGEKGKMRFDVFVGKPSEIRKVMLDRYFSTVKENKRFVELYKNWLLTEQRRKDWDSSVMEEISV